jgi:hypothetical protein
MASTIADHKERDASITGVIYTRKIDYGWSRNKVLFITVINLLALEVHMTTCCGSPWSAVKYSGAAWAW